MKRGRNTGVVALAFSLALSASARAAEANSGAGDPARAAVIRQIDDPGTGRHWLLERDPAHPGAPGRLVEVSGAAPIAKKNTLPSAGVPSPLLPVIRAGDPLVVSDQTAVVSARLEAVALEPAHPGKKFKIKLKFSGKILEAVAVASGSATVSADTGGWR